MRNRLVSFECAAAMAALVVAGATSRARAGQDDDREDRGGQQIQLGPRPFYLVDGMDAGPLKAKLSQCKAGPFYRTDFSIGHRGAALQFPEHTKEAYTIGPWYRSSGCPPIQGALAVDLPASPFGADGIENANVAPGPSFGSAHRRP
jgi:hypothetical protein